MTDDLFAPCAKPSVFSLWIVFFSIETTRITAETEFFPNSGINKVFLILIFTYEDAYLLESALLVAQL